MRARPFIRSSYFIFPIILFGMGCATIADQGNALFKRKGYAEAIDKYKRVLTKDSTNIAAAINMAESYLKNNQFEEAEDLYAKIIEDPEAAAVQKLHYAQQLMKSGKYEQAKTILELFKLDKLDVLDDEIIKSVDEIDDFLKSIDEIDNFFVNNGSFSVKNLNINSPEDDFSPTIYNNGLVFASARKKSSFITFLHAWNNKPFTNIYYSQGSKDQFSQPELFAEKLQTKYHNGAVTFTNNERQMYFTRNNITEGKVRRSADDLVNLKIFSSALLDSGWSEEYNFKYNSDEYHCAHPTISEDGQRLYFSSDMPADLFGKDRPICYGGMDLYVCERSGLDWEEPKNLGPEINTPGNEIFPFVQVDASIFFVSDGHVGFGGLDLYHSTLQENQWRSPQNLGSPVNTKYDDFGITVFEDGSSGYFCSNRPNGKGNDDLNDDIYSFEGLKIPVRLEVLVYDKNTEEPIENAIIQFTQNENSPEQFTTDPEGMIGKLILIDQNFSILASKEGYNEGTAILTADAYSEDSIPLIKIPLEKILIFSEPCEIFKEIDKYALDTFPMNNISRLNIASLLNDCTVEIGEQFYSKNDITLKKIPHGAIEISGRVFACDSNETISGVEVFVQQIDHLTNSAKGNKILKAITCADGKFSMYLLPNEDHNLSTSKFGWISTEDKLSIKSKASSLTQNIFMCGVKEDPNILDVFTDLDLKDILFDLNKHDIRPDAALELDKIVEKMNQFPSLVIELGSHTDSRGDDTYNLDLSDRRARSSAAYIVTKGIDRSRIIGKGYGETKLKNNCSNGVKCSVEEHQKNRRTEFKIIYIDEGHRIN